MKYLALFLIWIGSLGAIALIILLFLDGIRREGGGISLDPAAALVLIVFTPFIMGVVNNHLTLENGRLDAALTRLLPKYRASFTGRVPSRGSTRGLGRTTGPASCTLEKSRVSSPPPWRAGLYWRHRWRRDGYLKLTPVHRFRAGISSALSTRRLPAATREKLRNLVRSHWLKIITVKARPRIEIKAATMTASERGRP